MAVSSQPGSSPASRKILWLAVAVIAACLAYTGFWYYAAGQIRSRFTQFIAEQQQAGTTIECGSLSVNGFPFRFEVFCTKPGVADLTHGGSAEAQALRSAAQVYAPSHIVWEADGPLLATLESGEKLQLNWQSLQSSLQLKAGGLDHSSIMAEGLDLTFPAEGTVGVLKAKAAHGEAHIRQNGDNLDAAMLVKDVALTPQDAPPLPAFSASLEASLAGKAGALDGRITGPEVFRPSKGELQRAVVDFGNGRVTTLSGPFEIDDQGLISGRLALEMEKFTDWRPLLEGSMPDNADAISTAMGAIKGMADDKGTVRINLVLDKGQLLLGFIPLGIQVPPVQ